MTITRNTIFLFLALLFSAVWCFAAPCNIPDGDGGYDAVTVQISELPDMVLEDPLADVQSKLKAKSTGGTDDYLKWSATDPDTPIEFPDDDEGLEATVKLKNASWPKDNSSFGPKEIMLKYEAEDTTGNCTHDGKIKLFFKRTAPVDGGEPAWYRYWKDGVVDNLDQFELKEVIFIDKDEEKEAKGVFDPDKYTLGLKNQLPGLISIRTVHSGGKVALSKKWVNGLAGSDAVVEVSKTVEHELKHKSEFLEYGQFVENKWKKWYDGHSFWQRLQIKPIEALNKLIELYYDLDPDRDWIPVGEDQNDSKDDKEDVAEAAETGTACDPEKDWSKDG